MSYIPDATNNSTNPTILVERHHIPLSVYLQIYGQPSGTTQTANTYQQQPMRANPINSTIRTTRRTTFTMPTSQATTGPITSHTNYDSEDQQQPRTRTNTGRNTNNSTNNSIRIETLAAGDENDVSLFNALFTALINPSRADNFTGNNNRPAGLTTEQIADNSTVMTYAATDDTDNQPSSSICSICTLEYEPQQQIRSLDHCDHAFHTSCIDRWLADHNTCPLCRANVIPSATPSTNPSPNQSTNSARPTTYSRINLNGLD
jgi:hypothetical protein